MEPSKMLENHEWIPHPKTVCIRTASSNRACWYLSLEVVKFMASGLVPCEAEKIKHGKFRSNEGKEKILIFIRSGCHREMFFTRSRKVL